MSRFKRFARSLVSSYVLLGVNTLYTQYHAVWRVRLCSFATVWILNRKANCWTVPQAPSARFFIGWPVEKNDLHSRGDQSPLKISSRLNRRKCVRLLSLAEPPLTRNL